MEKECILSRLAYLEQECVWHRFYVLAVAGSKKQECCSFHFEISPVFLLLVFWVLDCHLKAKFQNFEYLDLYCNNYSKCSSIVSSI